MHMSVYVPDPPAAHYTSYEQQCANTVVTAVAAHRIHGLEASTYACTI